MSGTANPFDTFDTPSPAASQAPPSYPAVAPRYLQPGEAGYSPGPANPMTNLSPEDHKRFTAGVPPPAAATAPGATSAGPQPPAGAQANPFDAFDAPPDTRKTGVVSNVAAGGNAAAAMGLGAPVDLVTGGINLGIRGVNAATGTTIPEIVDPFGGSGTFKRAMGVIGANPDDVRPDGMIQEIARGVGGGVVSAAIPAGAVAGLVRGGMMAAPTAARTLSVLGDITRPNAILGATSGGAGEAAASAAPDEWKPLAGMAGGLAGVGVPVAAAAGLRGTVNGLRDYAAPAWGRKNTLADAAGNAALGSDGLPLVATRGQARLAGENLINNTTNPNAVRTILGEPPPPLVPGAEPTTFQLTRDPGIGQQEKRQAVRGRPTDVAAFRTRADNQNDARVADIRTLAENADPQAAATAVQQHAAQADAAHAGNVAQVQRETGDAVARIQQEGEAQGARMTAAAEQTRNAMGGDLPAGSDAQIGAALRAPADNANQAARTAERALWEAIDPDGTLAMNVTPIRRGATEILRDMSRNAAPLAGNEAGIFETARTLPAVQSFRDVAALRGRITDAIRQERGPTGDPQAVRRMSMLLERVNTAMEEAAIRAPEIPPAPIQRPAPVPARATGAPAVPGEVFTPSGKRVAVDYELVDAADLTTSHHNDMTPNADFPQELQPRERERAASELQVAKIARELQPERLGASTTVTDGAPIVGPDGLVESGNGRVLALRRAYAADGPQAQAYREWLTSQGHDLAGMKEPVLIRRRTTEMTPEERIAFTGEGSTPTTLAMSSPERARGDARRLTDDVLQALKPGGISDPANRDFVRAFRQNVIEPGQEGAFASADGALSKEGAARVEAALVHRAYGDSGLTAALTETTDPTARVLAGAMADAAGPMARLKAGIEAGAVDPAFDLAPALVEATQIVQQARSRGITVADAIAQQDAFNQPSALAIKVLQEAYGDSLTGQMSRTKMSDALAEFARRAEQRGVSADMFGENLSAQQLLESVSLRNGTEPAAGRQAANTSADATGMGRGPGGNGNQAQRPGNAPPGQAEHSGGPGAADPRILPEANPLTPNFDQAAADRAAAARQATAERHATYTNAPGVGEILQGGRTSGTFRMADQSVAAAVIRTGPEGAPRVRAYLAAGGSQAALEDAAAYSLRQFAMRADGTLDPAKYATWAQQRASFLSAVPDAAARFGAAAEAQRAAEAGAKGSAQLLKDAVKAAQETVDNAMAARANAAREMQNSAIGKFVEGADPVAVVGGILRDPKMGRAHMAQLVEAVKGNPDALAGLQRAVADHILTKLKGNAEGATSAERYLRNDQFQTFIRESGPALREVLTPEQMTLLENNAASLAESNLSVGGTRVGGGSDTIQKGGGLFGKVADAASGSVVGGSLGATIAALFDPSAAGWGYASGSGIGAALGDVFRKAREAGIENQQHLEAQALLNPAIFRLLITKVTPANQQSLLKALENRLGRISLVSTATGVQDRQRGESIPRPPANRLLH